MGLVQRQGIKYSIVNWAGVMIGVFSTLYIYPRALEEFGLLRFILDTAALLMPLYSLGISSVSIRFFPNFEDKASGHHGYLGLLMLWSLLGYALFGVAAWLLWQPILGFYTAQNALFAEHLWLLFPVAFLTLVNNVFSQYSMNFKRIVVPSLLMDFSQKLALPILVAAYWQGWIPLPWMLTGIVAYQTLVAAGFVVYIRHLEAWHWRPDWPFFWEKMFRPMLGYAVFGVVGGLGFLLVFKLDTWTVGTFVGLKNNGIYAIAAFIASIMEVPSRALVGISNPLIVKHWHDGNTAEIEVLYQKVSINLLIAGLLLFGAFWVSVKPFYQVIANGEMLEAGKWVILLLGIGKLVDMATGLNNYILTYSKYFRYSYLQIGLPALLGVGLNVLLAPRMGIVGIALATLASTIFYNLISLALNWYFFRLQPFSAHSVRVLGVASAAFAVAWLLPGPAHAWGCILLKSGTFAALFSAGVLWLRASPDLNELVGRVWGMIYRRQA